MKIIWKPGEKKVVLITLVIIAVFCVIMKIVLHFAPLAYSISN
jgi:hypothetical protein